MKCHFKFSRLSTVFHFLTFLAPRHGETFVVRICRDNRNCVHCVYIFFGDYEKGTVL